MKRKILDIIVIIITTFILYQVIVKKTIIYNSITYSLNIWVDNLVPTLFPFFVISDILINYNLTIYIPRTIKNIIKYLFNITDNMVTILILSIISGFPSNARNTRIMYDKGLITLDEANHILIFSHFSNPIFVLTTVGLFFLNDNKMGIIILISHYLSNFILGMIFRNYFNHNVDSDIVLENNKDYFGNIFINAIKKSIDTILLICGILTLFLLLSSIVTNILNLNIYNNMIISGLLEITVGIQLLGKLEISIIYKAVISSVFLAFGGLSVHMQVVSQITNTKINYKFFFIGRLFQMILSGIITYLICLFII